MSEDQPTGDKMERETSALVIHPDFVGQKPMDKGGLFDRSYEDLMRENPNLDAWNFNALLNAQEELSAKDEESVRNKLDMVRGEVGNRVFKFIRKNTDDPDIQNFLAVEAKLRSIEGKGADVRNAARSELFGLYDQFEDSKQPEEEIAKTAGEEREIRRYLYEDTEQRIYRAYPDRPAKKRPVVVSQTSAPDIRTEEPAPDIRAEAKDPSQMSAVEAWNLLQTMRASNGNEEFVGEIEKRLNILHKEAQQKRLIDPSATRVVVNMERQLETRMSLTGTTPQSLLDFDFHVQNAINDADSMAYKQESGLPTDSPYKGINRAFVQNRLQLLSRKIHKSSLELSQKVPENNGQPDFDPNEQTRQMMDQFAQTMNNLRQSFENGQQTNREQHEQLMKNLTASFLRAMQQQNERMVRTMSSESIHPFTERSRWVDMEHRQEFYTQFDPRSEPLFYKNIKDEQDRRMWDYRWRLARIAFYKKATNADPGRYRESQDVTLFTNEMIYEMLENVEGTKEMMSSYVEEVLNPDSEFWREIKKGEEDPAKGMNTEKFDAYRKKMRASHRNAVLVRMAGADAVFSRLSSAEQRRLTDRMSADQRRLPRREWMKTLSREQLALVLDQLDNNDLDHLKDSLSTQLKEKNLLVNGVTVDQYLDLKTKEADAVAWNTIYVSNLVEWADSADTISGKRHELPLILASDDYRSVHHPKEKGLAKAWSKHYGFSMLTRWSSANLYRIAHETGNLDSEGQVRDMNKYEYELASGESDYWTYQTRGENVVIKVPPIYAPTTVDSFLHKAGVISKDRSGGWLVDLDKFRTYRPSTGETEAEHPFGLWVATQFHKAMMLNQYADGSDRNNQLNLTVENLQLPRTCWAWADPLIELHQRLRLDKRLTKEQIINMNNLILVANTGGTRTPDARHPEMHYYDPIRRWATFYNLRKRGLVI